MLQLVAIDLDDTLLSPDGSISDRSKLVIRQIREAGVLVTLATGRMFRAAQPFAEELGLDLPLITYQGALIKTAVSGEVWRRASLSAAQLYPLLEALEQYDVHINLYVEDDLYVAEMNQIAADYARLSRVPVHPVGRLSRWSTEEATKVVAIGEPDFLRDRLQPRMNELFPDLKINRSRPHFLEFGNSAATKASALAYLGERLDIRREQMLAIGDSENDLDMIEYAGVGIAMGNSDPAVLATADHITGTNAEDGVALALEHYFSSLLMSRRGDLE